MYSTWRENPKMDAVIRSEKVTMVNPRGSLREIQAGMVPELKAQGWRIVVNPKREYFPELDAENKHNIVGHVEEELDQSSILQFEDI